MKKTKSNQLDIVTLTVINNALVNICREMGTAMMRTSYSPIFNEALDFSCVIFTPQGEMIGQAEFCPTMIGSAQYAVKWTIEELGLDSFEPGDVVIHNDPYRGQCHMPEHMVLKPVFFGKELRFFVANIAHVGEIGGMAPGSFAADATEVYQEGLRLPPDQDHAPWRVRERCVEDYSQQSPNSKVELGRPSRHDRLVEYC